MISKMSVESAKEPLSQVQVLNRQKRFKVFPKAVAEYCAALLGILGEARWTLTVVLVSPRKIQSLNRIYRGKDYPTDVLSFDYRGSSAEGGTVLGDLILCPEVASEQAHRWRTSVEREIRRLLAHGILHLLGYDHEGGRGGMHGLQRRLLRRRALKAVPPLVDSGS